MRRVSVTKLQSGYEDQPSKRLGLPPAMLEQLEKTFPREVPLLNPAHASSGELLWYLAGQQSVIQRFRVDTEAMQR